MAPLCLASSSSAALLHQILAPTPKPNPSSHLPFLSIPNGRHPPHKSLSFHTPRSLPLLPPLSALPNEAPAPLLHFEDLVEKDWSFLDSNPIGSDQDRERNARRIISAAEVGENSRVLVSFGTFGFVEWLVDECHCQLLLVIHDSLFQLAVIKEQYDKVRCWQGPVGEVPEIFSPFEVVFVCYFPGMGVSVDQLFGALAGRCSPGAKVVINLDGGRELVEQVHRKQFPDMVTSDLPDKVKLEKVASDHSFQLNEFVDEPTFYLSVLKFCEPGTGPE